MTHAANEAQRGYAACPRSPSTRGNRAGLPSSLKAVFPLLFSELTVKAKQRKDLGEDLTL